MKKVFLNGAIPSDMIADMIKKHSTKTDIGAHAIFLGQVRSDDVNGKKVIGIEYDAYKEMAEKEFHEIREESFQKFPITCLHIYHSMGLVKTGEISLCVFVSSKHRKASFEACEWIVEQIKKRVPIFAKELFDTNDYQWKENTP
ncbi:MAG: hypothetical protein KatS3mg027_1053 [Bacteroidia bacterium]|nr:MAG: hypothetical protein KatS3mg027_1053 [Bacteroidia bacterium]